MDAGAAISIDDVDIGYGGAPVQSGIRVEIERGEIFAIVGDSGSGKSTLLKTMIGLIPTCRGEIRFAGQPLSEHMERGVPPFGVLFQNGALWTSMTVEENVTLPMELQNYSTPAARPALARFKLALVGLAGHEHQSPASLSGGMRKRAALARALALDPGVLFLDEPSAGLDPLTSRRLDRLVTNLRDGLGITVVLVTHELESLYSIADRMLFLDGEAHRPVALGAPAELARHRRERQGPRVPARPPRGEHHPSGGRMIKPRPVAVGAFLLAALALLVGGILFFTAGTLTAKRLRTVSFFPGTVAGLQVGSTVTFQGVPVGHVTSLGVRVTQDVRRPIIQVEMELVPRRLAVYGSPGFRDDDDLVATLVQRGLAAQLIKESFITGRLGVELSFRTGVETSRVGDTEVPEVPTVPSDFRHSPGSCRLSTSPPRSSPSSAPSTRWRRWRAARASRARSTSCPQRSARSSARSKRCSAKSARARPNSRRRWLACVRWRHRWSATPPARRLPCAGRSRTRMRSSRIPKPWSIRAATTPCNCNARSTISQPHPRACAAWRSAWTATRASWCEGDSP